jgi:hypothetical protein
VALEVRRKNRLVHRSHPLLVGRLQGETAGDRRM